MSGTISSNIDALTFDRKKINVLLDSVSKSFTGAYAHLNDMEDRVKKMDSHFSNAQIDLNDILVTTKKISNKKEKLLKLDDTN